MVCLHTIQLMEDYIIFILQLREVKVNQQEIIFMKVLCWYNPCAEGGNTN